MTLFLAIFLFWMSVALIYSTRLAQRDSDKKNELIKAHVAEERRLRTELEESKSQARGANLFAKEWEQQARASAQDMAQWRGWLEEEFPEGEWDESDRQILAEFLKRETGEKLARMWKAYLGQKTAEAMEAYPHSQDRCAQAAGVRGLILWTMNLSVIRPPQEPENPADEDRGAHSPAERIAPNC